MKEWLEIAKDLPLGHKARIPCSQCGTNDKSLIVNHGSKSYNAYCFRCGDNPFEMKGELSLAELARIKELNNHAISKRLPLSLPEDYTTDIPLAGRLWLYSGGLTESVWREYGIGYSATLERVILPVYKNNTSKELVWYQCRAIHKGQSPKYIQPSDARDTVLFESAGKETDTRCVIVEDILSAIRVGKTRKAFSLLGTKITTPQANTLSKYKEVTTWLDSDKAGVTGAYSIRKALQLVTEVRNIVTAEDPKKLSDRDIRELLTNNKE